MAKKDNQFQHLLGIFLILSLLIGVTLGYVIGLNNQEEALFIDGAIGEAAFQTKEWPLYLDCRRIYSPSECNCLIYGNCGSVQ